MRFNLFNKKKASEETSGGGAKSGPSIPKIVTDTTDAVKAEPPSSPTLSTHSAASVKSSASSWRELGLRVKRSRIFRNPGLDENGHLKPEYAAVGGRVDWGEPTEGGW